MSEIKISGSYIDPRELFIAGIDTPPEGFDITRIAHLEDTVHNAESLDCDHMRGMIQSVEAHGVKTPVPVAVFRYGKSERLRVAIDGRSRVKAQREVNARLRKRGTDEKAIPLCPYIVDSDETTDLDPVIANEQRRVDGPIAKAQIAATMRKRHRSTEDILATVRACDGSPLTNRTLANYERLLKLPLELQAAVASGVMAATVGYELAKLPHEAALAAWRESGPKATVKDFKEAAASAPTNGTPPKPRTPSASTAGEGPTRRQLAALAERIRPVDPEKRGPRTPEEIETDARDTIVAAVLDWAAGALPTKRLAEVDEYIGGEAIKVMAPPTPKAPARIGKEVM